MATGVRGARAAISAIERHGALLVYPMANRKEPHSLWSVLYPGATMRWAWDDGADARVVSLWHLRAELAESRAVVYGKWYKGRAVFFSHELFVALLALFRGLPDVLSQDARDILRMLEEDSPQSSKALRKNAGLSGRHHERLWTRAMTALWERLWIVGTGEVEDGAFPSLSVGATRWIFEQHWEAAAVGPTDAQRRLIATCMPATGAFGKHLARVVSGPKQ